MLNRAFIFAVLVGVSLWAMLGQADSNSIGKLTLSGDVVELDNLVITATGNASLVSTSKASAKPGSMSLESIKAKSIRVDLTRDSKGNTSPRESSARGGVTIKAKRADIEADPAGKDVTVMRDVLATARTARLDQNQETLYLSGGAVVKVTERGESEPVAVITGEDITVFLTSNRIRVSGKPAELEFTPKEESKK